MTMRSHQTTDFGFDTLKAPSFLRHARRRLLDRLPGDHAFTKRVHVDGRLLIDQPAPKPRVPYSRIGKRGKQPDDPSEYIERQRLRAMLYDKLHLKTDWKKASQKMWENCKRMGMSAEFPFYENDLGDIENVLDSFSEEDTEAATNLTTNKKRKQRVDESLLEEEVVLFRGWQADEQPPKRKPKRYRRGSGRVPSPLGQHGDGTEISKSFDKTTNSSSWLPSWIQRQVDKESTDTDPATVEVDLLPFPSVEELLAAIPATGIRLEDIKDIFWDRISLDVHKLYCSLESNTNLNQETGMVFKRRAGCKNESPDIWDIVVSPKSDEKEQVEYSLPPWIFDGGNGTGGKVWDAEPLLPPVILSNLEGDSTNKSPKSVMTVETEMQNLYGRRLARQGGFGRRWDDQAVLPISQKRKRSVDDILF